MRVRLIQVLLVKIFSVLSGVFRRLNHFYWHETDIFKRAKILPKAQVSMRISAVLPEPSQFVHNKYETR